MKRSYLIIGAILIVLLAVMPAQAFTAKTLTITLSGNGDAQADMQYDLSFMEQAAIFLHAANPSATLQSALSANLGRQVTVNSADMSSANVLISSFATVTSQGGNSTTLTTPSFSFANAQNEVKNEWYGSLISADFAPQTTTITFPDGYQATYYNQISIPSVSHTIQ
ncbi:conserved hypothetical protein [Methanoregula boonei 6A8]|jgi:hypothetical protein|uniref:Uncharacterized protein n=1 Tax=Methanoregula boonei (strain DSM 21154 / JCM 14090 / 6A8) TaxID=456442 RepID=A7I6G6_METB6|nr:hypothetical protein [Methanoregula boonei]ABS55327.1 conserved hypothetical protein [Methanoregula boonei 6A8]